MIPIAYFTTSRFSQQTELSGKNISIITYNQYIIDGTDTFLDREKVIALANQGLINFYRSIPILSIEASQNVPNSVFVELVEDEFKTLKLKELRKKQNAEMNSAINIEKTQPFISQSVKIFIINTLVPGAGYIFQKRINSFILYLFNLLLIGYTLLKIFPNSIIALVVITIINYFVSVHMHNQIMYIGKFGSTSEFEAGNINYLLLIFPMVYIISQMLNALFLNGYMFSKLQTFILNNADKFPNVLPFIKRGPILGTSLTNILLYTMICVIISLITLGILVLFKKILFKRIKR